MNPLVGKGIQHPSGRVIALGRLMLATLFLLAILVDASQPALAPTTTYAILGTYVAFAAGVVVLTWSNWWLDARLAGPTHAIDIILFTLLVLLTEGYTSPFFTFFIFVLLSAAIRWGGYATALTAILLTMLYLAAGLLVTTSAPFELQRFVVRTGHLAILSLVLIWMGATRWRSRFHARDEDLFSRPSLDESPLETSLRAAMSGLGASAGVFVWRERGNGKFAGLAIRDGTLATVSVAEPALKEAVAAGPFLYDMGRDRALRKDAKRNLTGFAASEVITRQAVQKLALSEGLAIPVRSDDGEGELFFEHVRSLSADHIDLGAQIAADVSAHLQRHALLKAAEESAEARSRLTLARDLHDSIVQFLAGATFRLEAMKRSGTNGRDLEPEIDELKQLMLEEQRELRSFIKSLRSGPLVAFNDLATDLQGLAERLSRQWEVQCLVSALPAEMMIPTRLRLDAHQLIREAVANAVRHAKASSVTIGLAAVSDELRIELVNDGAGFPMRGKRLEPPTSLRERVEEAGGMIDMARGMGVTKMSISLPIGEKSR